jgi:hypothetical protein
MLACLSRLVMLLLACSLHVSLSFIAMPSHRLLPHSRNQKHHLRHASVKPSSEKCDVESVPKCRFGLIADIQFCLCDDLVVKVDGSPPVQRRYRQSLQSLLVAVVSWSRMGLNPQIKKLDFACVLGNLIDAKSGVDRHRCLEDVEGALRLATWGNWSLARTQSPWHIPPGNHDLKRFSRPELHRAAFKASPSPNQLHYDFSPVPGIRCFVLDG